MAHVARISIGQMHFTTVPDQRVADVTAELDRQRANRRTATDERERGTAERNIADLETALERANVNLKAHSNHMAKLEAERTAQRDEAEKRRQAADDQMKAQAKSTFLASNRTASEDDFDRVWPGMRDQMMIDQRNDAIDAVKASGRYAI